MKHKKYLRKQVEGDGEDSENVSDEKDDDEASINLKYIKKEDIRGGEDRDQLGNGRHLVGKLCFLSEYRFVRIFLTCTVIIGCGSKYKL